jgi:predicted Zn-dependent protease
VYPNSVYTAQRAYLAPDLESTMKKLVLTALCLAMYGCVTTPDGKKVFNMVDGAQLSAMGLSAFDEIKAKNKISADQGVQNYVKCITNKLIQELPAGYANQPWEVVVFEDETPNAFALPGGKVGVHTGLMKVAQTEDQLAAVIGHELSHVTFQHGGQRMSQQTAWEAAGGVAQAYLGRNGAPRNPYVEAAMGIGGQVGILLPFSRKHETQADREGQMLMARAGYDPAAASALWANMMAVSKGAPPEWMSTHPSSDKRMEQLGARAPDLQPLAETARSLGKGQACPR